MASLRAPVTLAAALVLLLLLLLLQPGAAFTLHRKRRSSGSSSGSGGGGFNYAEALRKSLLFFEAQRSGKLPPDQRVRWRGDSGPKDGKDVGADLSGGYYDSGDNLKFGLPLAFTVTTLAWGVVEFGAQMQAVGQLQYALQAIKWGADYIVNAHPQPNVLYGQVGDPTADHSCWQRPEDTRDQQKPTYVLDAQRPGSEVAAESAAALAAASLAWQYADRAYARTLLMHAQQLFSFADTYRGRYTSSIPAATTYYNSFSGYNDELLWAAAWLMRALPGNAQYAAYVANNGQSLGGTTMTAGEFSWDNKYAGAQILLSKAFFDGNQPAWVSGTLEQYWRRAQDYVCNTLKYTSRTPGGLLFLQPWSSLQYATSTSLTFSALAEYLDASSRSVACGDGTQVQPADLRAFAKSQIDYILGNNPLRMSYMVGFGSSYPQRYHHRGASIPSIQNIPPGMPCGDGWTYFHSQNPNPNLLEGAVVGGPDQGDGFRDERSNYQQNEPSTYVNAPLVGALARLAGGPSKPGLGLSGGGKKPLVSPLQSPSPAPSPAWRSSPPPLFPSPPVGSLKPTPETPSSGGKQSNGASRRHVSVKVEKRGKSWRFQGQLLMYYVVTVRNVCSMPLVDVRLRAASFHPFKYQGLTLLGKNVYRLNSLVGGRTSGSSKPAIILRPGSTITFSFIQTGRPAAFAEAGATVSSSRSRST